MQTVNVTQYDLDRIGWQQFEQLVQALAIAELGNGVRVFGAGKDGGREATFKGKQSFPKGGGEQWNGYGVIQAKHLERPASTTNGWRTFLTHVSNELETWSARLKSGRLSLERQPKYFIFATNIALSGTDQTGGIDQFEALLEGYRDKLQLKGWFAWDYHQLASLLDSHPNIRQTYLEQIIPGDLLARMDALLPPEPAKAGRALSLQAAKELTSKQWVRIGDAGYDTGAKLPLSAIGIDLPSTSSTDMTLEGASRRARIRTGAAAATLAAAETICRPDSGGTRGVVLIGGPGQGKSTLAQLIAHTYRVAFLESSDVQHLAPKTNEALVQIRSRLDRAGFPHPQRRRFPLVVDLAKLGAYLVRQEERGSLLNYLSEQITSDGQSLTPASFLGWLSYWPSCLVLDGLDEVPSSKARVRVIAAISDFLLETSHKNADVFVVATTRPQGYRGEFEEAVHTKELRLLELTESEALSYSETIVEARGEDDPDLQTQVLERLFGAVHSRLTQRLMSTPLQVTIMAALAERSVDLPTTRYELFDAYYATIYDREIGKSQDSRKLRRLRSHVDHLHERAGIQLHRKAESAGGSDQLLKTAQLKRILDRRLSAAGFESSEARTTTEDLLQLASDRLVLLISPHGREWGFEVRSIQEYMAARAITEGTDDEVLSRLKVILPAAHWRNVWLLAAGRVMKSREHLKGALLDLLAQADDQAPENELTLPGASLAVDLYNDEIASDFPTLRKALLARGLNLLNDTRGQFGVELTEAIAFAQREGKSYDDCLNESVEKIASQSTSNLAMRLLHQYRHNRDGFGLIARRTLIGGRSYVSPSDRSVHDRMFVLGQYLHRLENPSRGITELAIELSNRVPAKDRRLNEGYAARAPHTSSVVLGLLASAAVRQTFGDMLKLLRHSEPDAAQLGVDLLREREVTAPVSEKLVI
jgi:hypothetical protein